MTGKILRILGFPTFRSIKVEDEVWHRLHVRSTPTERVAIPCGRGDIGADLTVSCIPPLLHGAPSIAVALPAGLVDVSSPDKVARREQRLKKKRGSSIAASGRIGDDSQTSSLAHRHFSTSLERLAFADSFCRRRSFSIMRALRASLRCWCDNLRSEEKLEQIPTRLKMPRL